MKRLKLLTDYEGCKAGEVVGFENELEATALLKLGIADWPDGAVVPVEDATPVISTAERMVLSAADVGTLNEAPGDA